MTLMFENEEITKAGLRIETRGYYHDAAAVVYSYTFDKNNELIQDHCVRMDIGDFARMSKAILSEYLIEFYSSSEDTDKKALPPPSSGQITDWNDDGY